MFCKEEGRERATCFIKRKVERKPCVFYKEDGREKATCCIKRKVERKPCVI